MNPTKRWLQRLSAVLLTAVWGYGAVPTSSVRQDQLHFPVRVVEDGDGVPHIFAADDWDALFVQGFLHARSRFFQMDSLRRLFSGTLAELAGEGALAGDVELRTLGFRRAAEEAWQAMPSPDQERLQAYAQGVNAWLQSDDELPREYAALELTQAAPWTPVDTLTVVKGVLFARSFDFSAEIDATLALAEFQAAGQQGGFDGTALFFEDIYRAAPFDPVTTVPRFEPASSRTRSAKALSVPDVRTLLGGQTLALARRYRQRLVSLPPIEKLLNSMRRGQGSNWWILSGTLTQSGHALLAGDPHLDLTQPGLWYQNHLVVRRDPSRGAMDVNGVSVPGVPGIGIGCNRRICWSITTNPLDIADIYRETLTAGADGLPGTSLFRGKQETLQRIVQTFRFNAASSGVADDLRTADVSASAGGVTFIVPRRNFGPLVAFDSSGPGLFVGLSVQQTGARATREMESLLRLARADEFESFRQALELFDTPFNFAYADVQGNIGYAATGEVPLREDLQMLERVDGLPPFLIRDGSGAALNEWIPQDDPGPGQSLRFAVLPGQELPLSFNPPQGYLANSNNDPLGLVFDNDLFNDRRPGGGLYYLFWQTLSLRAFRVDQLIQEQPAGGLFDSESLQQMQADSRFADAEALLPHLLNAFQRASQPTAAPALSALAADAKIAEAVERLSNWDLSSPTGIQQGFDAGDDPSQLPAPSSQEIANSVAATIYSAWRSQFLRDLLDATLARHGIASGVPDFIEIPLKAARRLLDEFPQSNGRGASGLDFFEGQGGASPEDDRDLLMLRSLRSALQLLAGPSLAPAFARSSSQTDYRWGHLHRVVFNHPLGGPFSIPPSGGFSHLSAGLPGLARPGGFETVDNGPDGVYLSNANSFLYDSGASPRLVAELNPAGVQAWIVQAGGQSGDPDSPHYADQLRLWLTNRYHPMRSASDEIAQAAESEQVFAPRSQRFDYPIDQADARRFTAFAAANLSSSPVQLDFTARAAAGEAVLAPALLLAPGAQSARLGREIFASAALPRQGWVSLDASLPGQLAPSQPLLATFTQLGDFALGSLDGSTAVDQPSSRLFFTRLHQGAQAFRGRAARTVINLVNPQPHAIQVQFRLFRPDGADVLLAHRDIAAGAALSEALDQIFPEAVPLSGGYLQADVEDGFGAVGALLVEVESGRSLFLLDAAAGAPDRIGFSAQLASAEGIFTSLKLINTAEQPRHVRLMTLSEDGSPLREDVSLHLAPGACWESDPLAAAASPPLIGSLRVESDGPGVIGDVVFGDPAQAAFLAALPLQSEALRQGLFPHLANLTGVFFTGLALHNPSQEAAEVEVEAFQPDGESLGQTVLAMAAGTRLSRTVEELIPETAGRQGGYLTIRSSVPVVAQVLFGTNDLSLLSAVPVQVVEQD